MKTKESLGTVTVREGFAAGGLMLTPPSSDYHRMGLVAHCIVTVAENTAQVTLQNKALRDELAAWDAASDEVWEQMPG